jgi:hypothetical protein
MSGSVFKSQVAFRFKDAPKAKDAVNSTTASNTMIHKVKNLFIKFIKTSLNL